MFSTKKNTARFIECERIIECDERFIEVVCERVELSAEVNSAFIANACVPSQEASFFLRRPLSTNHVGMAW